jgi:transposase
MRSESILAWPNEDIAAQKAKRIAIETELKELEQDFDYLLGNRLSPDQFKERMKDIFDRLVKADPDRQKEFLREIFTKIEVHRSNQIKLVWKLPNGCDSGGRGFAYRNKTGGWRSFIRTTFPPPEFSIIKPFCAYPVYRDADFLHQKYTLEKLSCEEIAAQISSSRTTVLKWLKLCGIRPRRSDYKDKGNSTPFGSTPKENRVIEKMKALRDKRYSYWKIAEILNAINTRTKTGKGIWHARTVQRILNDLNVI